MIQIMAAACAHGKVLIRCNELERNQAPEMQRYRRLRWAYLSVGWLGSALGITGAFLPVLPTTPFLLVAAWGFGRSSPVLHRWLLTHPRFGGTLRGWQDHGAIAPWIKVVALAGLASSVFAVWSLTALPWLRVLHFLVVTATAMFIMSRPSPASAAPSPGAIGPAHAD
ncbi:MAG: YbaN family protein [Woeseia sp.]